MKLPDNERNNLHSALKDAFPNMQYLDVLVQAALGIPLDNISTKSHDSAVWDVITYVEGWELITQFIEKALEKNSTNTTLGECGRAILKRLKSESLERVVVTAPTPYRSVVTVIREPQIKDRERTSLPGLTGVGLPSTAATPQKEVAYEDPELISLGRDIHWDRDTPTKDFLKMIRRRDTGEEKDKKRVLVLQGREAGLGSLVDRFEAMCNKVVTNRPLLVARIRLSSLDTDYYLLTTKIVEELLSFVERNMLGGQESVLKEVQSFIDQAQNNTGPQKPTQGQFASDLIKTHLKNVARDCTLVLFLQGFDKLQDNSTSEWLLKYWLTRFSTCEDRIVVVLTSEAGLEGLKGQQYVSYHDVPPLNADTLREWAIESNEYGFKWFTGKHAEKAFEICNGNPEKFRKLLEYTKSVLEVGESLAQSRYQSTQQTPSGGSE